MLIKKNKLLVFCFVSVIFLGSFLANISAAEAGIWDRIEGCRNTGDCQLRDFAQLTVNVAQWILGITGSLALLAFVYGGVLFLVSGGSSERIAKGKQAIVGAVIGIVIVMASYLIIGFVFKALDVNVNDSAWAQTGWFNSYSDPRHDPY